jgi:hypothetical protein
MPRLDGTGPQGQGPMTGRGMGNCRGVGRGFLGRGFGFGRGFGRWCPFANNTQALTKEEQKKLLLEEKEAIEQELANLDK